MNFKHQIIVFIIIILVLFLISCGRGHRSSVATDNRSVLSNSGVSVTVFDNTGKIVTNPSEKYSLCVTKAGDCRQVVVALKQQDSMRTCFLEVQFDGTKEHPTEIQCGSALLKHQPLSYLGSPEAGKVVSAQVILGEKSIKVNGELLRIKLSAGSHLVRTVSGFNQNPASDPILVDVSVDPFDLNKIYWTYKLRGDADNSQVFDFADFAAVGEKFGASVKSNPALEPADANNNGLIDFADFGVIGANYGRGIGGLKIYRDDSPAPRRLLGLISTNPLFVGNYTLKSTNQTTLQNGFKRFWFIETVGSGQYCKLELIDLNKSYLDGQTQTSSSQTTSYKPEDDWRMSGHDSQHTGRSPFIGPSTNSLNWTFKTDSYIDTSPVISKDGTVYVVSRIGTVFAIDSDGSKKWTYQIGATSYSTPAIGSDGTLYVTSSTDLYALNPDGSLKWKYNSVNCTYTSLVLDQEDNIYFASSDKLIYAIYPNGTLKWKFPTEDTVRSTPAIGKDGKVYFGCWDKNVYSLDQDGILLWKFPTEGRFNTSPAIDNTGIVYIGSEDKNLYALNPDGTYKWSFAFEGSFNFSPAIGTQGTIVFSCGEKQLYSLLPDGSLNWTTNIDETIYTSPSIGGDNTIYLGTQNKKVYAINSDGKSKWTFDTGDAVYSSPCIGVDGSLYFGCNNNILYSIGPGVGKFGLNPPSNVKATDGPVDGSTADSIEISWSVPTSGYDPYGYRIYKATTINGIYNKIGEVLAETSFKDKQISNSNVYFYKVSSVRNNIESDLSEADAGSLKGGKHPILNPPNTFKATDGEYTNKVELTWTPPLIGDTPEGYKIYRANSSTGTFTNIATVWARTSYDDAFITDKNVYYYKIHSVTGSDESTLNKSDVGYSYPTGAQSDWWMLGGNRGHTGKSKYLGPASYDLDWKFNVGSSIFTNISIGSNGTLYFGSSNKLYAVSPDGSQEWIFTTKGSVSSTPAIGLDGTIYFGCQDKTFYALNPDGTLKWSFLTKSEINASPAIGIDGVIYFCSYDKNVYALYPNGTLKWSYDTGAYNSSPAISNDGTIYLGASDKKLYAFDSNGHIKWTFEATYVVGVPVIGDDGIIYFVTNDRKLYAVNPNGTQKWVYQSPENYIFNPIIDYKNNSIYIESYVGSLYALSLEGKVKWTFDSHGTGYSTPVIGADGLVYIGNDLEDYLYALNPDGTIAWNQKNEFSYKSSFSIGDNGTLYVANGNYVDAVKRSTDTTRIFNPNNVTATKGTFTDKVQLSWSSPTYGEVPDGYNIYRSNSIDGTFELIDSIDPANSYTDKSLSNLTVYYYKISSKFGSHESSLSKEVMGFLLVDVGIKDWWMYGRDARHTCQSPFKGPTNINSIKWSVDLYKNINTSPSMGKDGTMYIGCENSMIAIHYNGAEKWSFDTGGYILSTPAIGNDGSIYFGCNDMKLYAVNPNGSLKWSYSTEGMIRSSPAIDSNGIIYFGSNDMNVYALNPNGSLKWSYNSSDGKAYKPMGSIKVTPPSSDYSHFTSPALGSDGSIYIGSFDKKLYALNPDGSLKWTFETNGEIIASPAIGSDDTVYIGSFDYKGWLSQKGGNYLYAINSDGSLKWKYDTKKILEHSPAIGSDGTIYNCISGDIGAFNPDGTLKWQTNTGSYNGSDLAIDSKGSIYFTNGSLQLYEVDPNGKVIQNTKFLHTYHSPIICPDGSIIIGDISKGGQGSSIKLYAIGPGNGK